MSWLVVLVADAGVHEDGLGEDLRPVGVVDVPEDMHSWTQRVDTEQKVLAPERHIYIGCLPDLALWPGEDSIEYPERRGMRDQYIRVIRDELPFLLELVSTRKIEGPIIEGWLPGGPPELHTAKPRA